MTLRSRALVAALVTALVLAGCGGSDDQSGTTTTRAGDARFGRVVALGEEFLLADLLALGVRPVASTATVADAGFQGMDEADTDGIEPLPSDKEDLERLAALRPDTIVTTQFIVEQVGRNKLEAMAELIVLPDELSERERLDRLGEVFGRERQATALRADVERARAAAVAATPADCRVSVATVYPGPSLAAWVGAPNAIATALIEMGCALAPDASAGTVDVSGRVRLSLEEIGQLDAPRLVLLQNSTVQGEDAALADVEQNTLWTRLPAVSAGDVVVLDRLGYPGANGRIRLYQDLTEAVGG